MLNAADKFKIEPEKEKVKTVDDEMDVERELNKMKSNRSSVDSLMGETPSVFFKKNKKVDDRLIDKVVKPIVPKKKNELISTSKLLLHPNRTSSPDQQKHKDS